MLPFEFEKRMESLLGDEYTAFRQALDKPATRAFRINRIKFKDGDVASLLGVSKSELKAIPYISGGYVPNEDIAEGLGNDPAHHAGIIYIQDAGAMGAIAAVDIKPDFYVCDLCASPGGKTTQVAPFLGDEGFILSNEFVPKRAKVLVNNVERMGIKCSVVTSLDTSYIKDMYNAFFDLVIADAPCSGEGMFRKGDAAEDNWSTENVLASAKRQKEILNNAKGLVKDGGYLLYSTCTYSHEENEIQILNFLKENEDFTLVPVKRELIDASCAGSLPDHIDPKGLDITLTRRFYPHKTMGEGQFIALMRRNCPDKPCINYKDPTKPLSREETEAVTGFFKENMICPPKGKLRKCGDNIVIISHGVPLPPRSVFSGGVLIGEVRGKLLFPSHQLFSAYGELFTRKIDLKRELAEKYLCGEEIDCPTNGNASGYCAITYHGATIGGGKISQGKIKNHYPKGLRKIKK